MTDLNGRVTLITGGASGIGRAMAQAFVEAGARVLAVDISEERLVEVAETIGAPEALKTFVADVRDPSAANEMLAEAERRFAPVDVICNNAGVLDHMMTVGETTDEVWEHVLSVNLTAPFQICRAALPGMLERGSGNFVNICSVASLFGGRAGFAYTATKHGLLGLTRSIAVTYGAQGIRSNGIAPGSVKTDLAANALPSEAGLQLREKGLATRPYRAESSDIAPIAVFLASDESRYMNGACLVADAGWTAY